MLSFVTAQTSKPFDHVSIMHVDILLYSNQLQLPQCLKCQEVSLRRRRKLHLMDQRWLEVVSVWSIQHSIYTTHRHYSVICLTPIFNRKWQASRRKKRIIINIMEHATSIYKVTECCTIILTGRSVNSSLCLIGIFQDMWPLFRVCFLLLISALISTFLKIQIKNLFVMQLSQEPVCLSGWETELQIRTSSVWG